MSWDLVNLGDVTEFIRGVTFKPSELVDFGSEDSIVCMRTKNVQKQLDESDLISIPVSNVKNKKKIIIEGDLLVSTANSFELVGKSCWVPKLDYPATAGGFISIFRADKKSTDQRYLYHWINSNATQHMLRYCGRQTTNISNMDFDRARQLKIPLPPLKEQKRIATILDKADNLRRKRAQAIQLADQFLRSVFLDMFGDPVANPKGWELSSLSDYGSFKNGLNFNKGESGISVHHLGVGNFKSFARIDGVDSLSQINLNSFPADDYFLKNGDIVFVRSNGNKALVGRCISVFPGNNKVTFSGFCIRYRIENKNLESIYLNYLFRMPSAKQAMLQSGRGANIQNINQKILSDINIPIPPHNLQLKFSGIVDKYKKLVDINSENLMEFDSFFSSISRKAFSGEL